MIRGHLRIFMLKALGDGEQTGYAIRKYVEEKTGHAPSYGSIYPQLEQLAEKKLVSIKKEGRKKKYSLTKKGRTRLKELLSKKDEIISKVEEGLGLLATISPEDDERMIRGMLNTLKREEVPFQVLNPEIQELRRTLYGLVISGKVKGRRIKIRKILKHANEELKVLL